MSDARDAMLSLLVSTNTNTPEASSLDQFYKKKLLPSAIALTEFGERTTMQEEDVRYAATTLGFTIPETLEQVEVEDEFKALTRKELVDMKNDIEVTNGAYKVLRAIYEASEHGAVTLTPSKEGTSYRLESPVGVNANLFERNFEAMVLDDHDENEEDDEDVVAEEESDEESDEDEEEESDGDL